MSEETSLGDMDFALKLRGAIESVAAGLIGQIIPKSFMGEVISFDPFNKTALVKTSGDDEPILVKFSPANTPSYGRVGSARGNIVQVTGTVGNYRITEILDEAWANRGGLLPARYYNWDSRYFSWSQYFSYVGFGKGPFSSTGQFKINMPPLGTVVPVHGSPNFTSYITTGTSFGQGFDLGLEGEFMSLWYEPTFHGSGVSDDTKFHLVCTTDPFAIPNHWIMIAARNELDIGNSLKVGTGQNYDHWREPTSGDLLGNYNQYAGSTFDKFGYRKVDSRVQLTGEMETSGVTGFIDTVFTLPSAFRPKNRQRLAALGELKSTFGQSAGTAHYHTMPNVSVKIEVYAGGDFRVSDGNIHENCDYISFYGLGFDAGS